MNTKPDLTTTEAVLERFRDGLEWGIDDDDVPGYWPEDWELAGYIAECVRLRQWFDDNQRPETGMGGSIISERRMPTYWSEQMRDAMKGGNP